MSEEKTAKKYFDKERIQRLVPAAVVSVGIALLLFIAGPLEIFANNMAELRLPLSSFIYWLVLYFFVDVLFNIAILFFMPKKAYKWVYVFFVFVLLMLFLQMSFFNFGSASLGGDNLETGDEYITYAIIDTVLWLVFAAGIICAVIFVKKVGIVKTVCLVLTAALALSQLVSILVISVSTEDLNGDYHISEGIQEIGLTTKNLNKISQNKNVFIFCVDRFDSLEYGIPALEQHPEVFENLTGFTFFHDNVSRYGHTYPAICNMLTGIDNFGQARFDYFNYAYGNNKTISLLNEKGYAVNLYTCNYYGYETTTEMPNYIQNKAFTKFLKVENQPFVAIVFAGMSLQRCLPQILKGVLIPGLSSSTVSAYLKYEVQDENKEGNEKIYDTDMKFVHDYLEENGMEVVNDDIFSFVHLEGCHSVPYDTDWNRTSSNDMMLSVQNSFAIIDEYLNALKNCGAYDNATIIITGDHSCPHGDYRENASPSLTAMFVKPAHSTNEPLKISDAQVSHQNLWATIFQSEGIETSDDWGRSMFDISPTETVEREYIWDFSFGSISWQQSIWKVVGAGRDYSNWTLKQELQHNQKMYD